MGEDGEDFGDVPFYWEPNYGPGTGTNWTMMDPNGEMVGRSTSSGYQPYTGPGIGGGEDDWWNDPDVTDWVMNGGGAAGGQQPSSPPPQVPQYAMPQGSGQSRSQSMGGGAPQFNPRGTPYTPGSSSSFSGPTLPPPNLGRPDNAIYSRLSSVLSDPSQIKNDALYKFLQSQGTEARNRQSFAQKEALSGKAGSEMEQFGQGLAAQYFQNLIPQLMGGASQELQRYAVPAQMELGKYSASRGGASSQMGPNPGTARDYGAADALNYMLAGGGPGGGGGATNFWGPPDVSGTRLPPPAGFRETYTSDYPAYGGFQSASSYL